ncbi:hypothetical protein [Lacinutrix sp. MEBiC02595]
MPGAKDFRAKQAQHISNGRFDKAMKMDIMDIKSKTKSGLMKNDYSKSMADVIDRARFRKKITEAQQKKLKKMAYSK